MAKNVVIGPYSVIDGEVQIGDNTWIDHHVSISGRTTIGTDNKFFSFSSIGKVSQDAKPAESPASLTIGDRNTFRENTTVNLGSRGQCLTQIGHDNLLMAGVHVAHDCRIDNQVIIANNTIMAGHVQINDCAVIGGACAIHQFCRIGRHCMIGGTARVLHDIPPFLLADGNPARPKYINSVGLKRVPFTSAQIDRMMQLFRVLYSGNARQDERLKLLEKMADQGEEEMIFFDFVSHPSQRGIVRFRK